MKPDLELVEIAGAQSFKAWEHGYPFRTVRWHFHPQCELHQVVATHGRYFVGDFIGDFEPGNLVLTGPNLPHNWVSELPPEATVALRGRVLQFDEQFLLDASKTFGELCDLGPLLAQSRRGVLFDAATSQAVAPLLAELVTATGLRRLELFLSILGCLNRASGTRMLASVSYLPDPSGFMATGINESLAYIRDNLTEAFDEKDLAEISRLSAGAFSRSFRRHTGMALRQYVNRLRINLASQLLTGDTPPSVTDVCFASGFRNLSNFNRQFLRQKGVTPSRFRAMQGASRGPQ